MDTIQGWRVCWGPASRSFKLISCNSRLEQAGTVNEGAEQFPQQVGTIETTT